MQHRKPANGEPANHDNWLGRLAAAGVCLEFDSVLAETLRVVAGVRQDAVCLCSGPGTLPYVGWLRDGLRMSSRLIIHLEPSLEKLGNLVQQQLDDDIRVAGHFQDLESFSRDIARHRIDLLVAELNDANRAAMGGMISLLTDEALMVIVADGKLQPELRSDYADEYFVAPVGSHTAALMLSRKGRQHRLVRRGSRRRAID